MKINDTTRCFPRTTADAFRENYYDIQARQRWEWLEGSQNDSYAQAEFWVYITIAFAAGFLTCLLWGAK